MLPNAENSVSKTDGFTIQTFTQVQVGFCVN